MLFRFNRLTLLANIVILQFTEISELINLPPVIEYQNHDFSHTFTVNFATFGPTTKWHPRPWNLLFKTHSTANRLCKHTDFVFTSKSILNFSGRTSWPQNYSFDSFLVRAGHLVFLLGNQRKNKKTNSLNNFSFTMSENVQHKRPILCRMLNSLQIQSAIATTNVSFNY